MASTTLPNLGMVYNWSLGEDGWNTGMDANLLKLDTTSHLSVKDYTLSTPPVSPSSGDRYIVATGGSGAWNGQDGKVAVYISSSWTFYTPKEGWKAWDENSNREVGYNGTSWVLDLDGDRAYADTAIGNVKLGIGTSNVIIRGWKFFVGDLPGSTTTQTPYDDIGATAFSRENLSTADLDAMTGASSTVDALKFVLNTTGNSSSTGICREGFISGSSDISCPRWRTGDKHQYLIRCAFTDLLPDGSNNFVYRVGVAYSNGSRLVDSDPFNNHAAGSAADGFAAFFVVDNSSAYIKCSSGYLTTTESTTTSVLAALATFYSFKIVIATDGVVRFYINGTLVATHSTGVCVNGAGMMEQIAIRNQAITATAKKGVVLDEIAYKYELGTARTGFSFD